MGVLTSLQELEAIYGVPAEASIVKEADVVTAQYRRLIEASPFAILATAGPEGLDCSPRGDLPGFVRVQDEKTLLIPDRKGNNRIDSLRNIIRDPRVALLFLIPGSGTTLRVNGQAQLTTDVPLLQSFAIENQVPRTVAIVQVETVYFQCARAIIRSKLWGTTEERRDLPTPGEILACLSEQRIGGEEYDRRWPDRARNTLW